MDLSVIYLSIKHKLNSRIKKPNYSRNRAILFDEIAETKVEKKFREIDNYVNYSMLFYRFY